MSDTQAEEAAVSVSQTDMPEEPTEIAIPLMKFIQTLRPQVAERHPDGRPRKFSTGHPDEIWSKVL